MFVLAASHRRLVFMQPKIISLGMKHGIKLYAEWKQSSFRKRTPSARQRNTREDVSGPAVNEREEAKPQERREV